MSSAAKIDIKKFKFVPFPDKQWGNAKLKAYVGKIPGRSKLEGVGIDPGRNFGIASIRGRDIRVLVGTLAKEEEQWMYGIGAYDMMAAAHSVLKANEIVVEGGFGQVPGAVNLAYARMGFVLGAYYMGMSVDIVPPNKIRKAVLGSGKIDTDYLDGMWGLPDHGSDALVCALYAAGVRRSQLVVPAAVGAKK